MALVALIEIPPFSGVSTFFLEKERGRFFLKKVKPEEPLKAHHILVDLASPLFMAGLPTSGDFIRLLLKPRCIAQ